MKAQLVLGGMILGFLAACVTINVYFPAAEAEKAADRIIDNVRGVTTEEGETSHLQRDRAEPSLLLALAERGIGLLVGVAHAQPKVDFNASSPSTEKLQASLRARFAELKPYFESGAIGMTREGLLDVRDRNLIPLADRNRVLRLVAEQNRDWNALYREIAKANGNPGWESEIRSTFAKRHVAKLESGWYYEDASGAWTQK